MLDDQCSIYQSSTGAVNGLLFQSSADCIKILDRAGNVVELNPGGVAALELDDAAQMTGKHWATFWPSDSQDLVADAVARAMEGRRAQFSAFCPTARGGERWWDVVLSPIFDGAGEVFQLMVVSRDVTDIVLARMALQEANQRKDEFLALLSHELRNPLAAAGMAASVLQTQSLAPARVAEIGKLVERQVQHMSRLAEDLLDVSRLTRGDIRLALESVDMRDVVRAALEQLHAGIAAKSQRLTVDLGEQSCVVLGDRTRLVQIIGNVVSNAVRYTPGHGLIALAMDCQDGQVTITVKDNGVGIAAEELPTLFELYKQAGQLDIRKSGGLGIGLALVRSLLDLHGGTITAHSDGAGRGSTFILSIPAAAST
jgi:PAS domain S-box-containing protein